MHTVRAAAYALFSRSATLLKSVQEPLGQAVCDVFTDLIVPNVGQATPPKGSPTPPSASACVSLRAAASPRPSLPTVPSQGARIGGSSATERPLIALLFSPIRSQTSGNQPAVCSPSKHPCSSLLLSSAQFQPFGYSAGFSQTRSAEPCQLSPDSAAHYPSGFIPLLT